MRGGFVRLALQGFLTLFPAREPLGGERETALFTRKRTPQADFFDTRKRPCRPPCITQSYFFLSHFLIESGDMRGGFVSLAQQGFLTLFPAREPLGGERETALYTRKRTPQADFFDTLKARPARAKLTLRACAKGFSPV